MKTNFTSLFPRAAMALLLTLLTSLSAWADESGDCGANGNNVTYSYKESTNTLTISGTGAMADFKVSERPWTSYKSDIKHLVINVGVTTIGKNAFGYCPSLESIDIPAGVTTIGENAFGFCREIKNISIPASVTNIGNYAFYNCHNLTSVTIPDNVTTIGDKAFFGCSVLTTVKIGSGLTSIGIGAFGSCRNLKTITVDENNTAFKVDDTTGVLFTKDEKTLVVYPTSLSATEYAIPNSVTTICGYAFYSCSNLATITIPASVTSIGEYAFSDTTWLDNQSDGVVYINNIAVFGKNISGAVEIEPGTVAIVGGCFESCHNLTSVIIPASVTSIGYEAFYYCDKLETVTIDGNSQLTTIGNRAFRDCRMLTSINIPASVTTIGDEAFENCSVLTTVTFEANSQLTTIGVQAFYDCKKLTSITIPASVTSIGDEAFYECSVMTNVTFEANSQLTTIGVQAFYECKKLTSINIPASVTTIGDEAFENCSVLTTVTIEEGSQLATIGEYAFSNCQYLNRILVLAATPPTLGSKAFVYIDYDATFIVRNDNYLTANGWSDVYGNAGDYSSSSYEFTMVVLDESIKQMAYIDEDGKLAISPLAYPITSSNTNVDFDCDGDTWYYVSGNVTIGGGLRFNGGTGTANLILCDGATLTVKNINAEHNLNIYQQKKVNAVGAMTITNSEDNSTSIYVKNDLTINGGIITVSNTGKDSDGIYAEEGNITIKSGTIGVTCDSEGIYADEGNITINGGTIDVTSDSEGIYADEGNITINSGTITVQNADYGIDSGGDCLTVNGGTITVKNSEDAFYANNNILISGGNINVNNASSKGIYASNGDITISSGSVTIDNAVTGIHANDGDITISGGRVVANGTNYGMYADGDITLGYSSSDDYICASSYYSYNTVSITDGQMLSCDEGDGSFNTISGTINDPNVLKSLEGNYLYPAVDAITLTMNASGIRTFACAQNLDFTGIEGLTAYIVSDFDGDAGTLTLTPVTQVPAGTGLLLKGTADKTFTIPTMASATAITTNYLVGVMNDETVVNQTETKGENEYTNFILANGKYGIDWYALSADGPIGANKAYLSLPTSQLNLSNNAAGFTWIYGDDETTPLSEKVIVNSEQFATAQWYTLDGRKLDGKPAKKGVYIFGNKQVVIK